MSNTIALKSIGRIISALPNGFVLDCEQPDKPHQSRVVIKRAAEGIFTCALKAPVTREVVS